MNKVAIYRSLVYRCLSSLMILAGLAACTPKTEDLEAFVAEVKARPRGAIEPLPEYPPYSTYIYNSMSLRSPFQQPSPKVETTTENVLISSKTPDLNRAKDPLERFEVDELVMVGVIGDKDGPQALLRVDGQIYRAAVGDYIGKNNGQIVAVGEESLSFVELVSAGVDLWTERPRIIEFETSGN